MPYISQDARFRFKRTLESLDLIETKGELEYCIFKLMRQYMRNKEYKYSTLHDCVYAAVHCGHEFERRFLDTRENKAMLENGEIL